MQRYYVHYKLAVYAVEIIDFFVNKCCMSRYSRKRAVVRKGRKTSTPIMHRAWSDYSWAGIQTCRSISCSFHKSHRCLFSSMFICQPKSTRWHKNIDLNKHLGACHTGKCINITYSSFAYTTNTVTIQNGQQFCLIMAFKTGTNTSKLTSSNLSKSRLFQLFKIIPIHLASERKTPTNGDAKKVSCKNICVQSPYKACL